MIEISNLEKFYGKTKILNGISAHIKKGEIFAIVGQSGAGKSTLLRCMNGLEDYQNGSLKISNKEVKDLKGDELRKFRRNMGMIFQNFALMSRKTVAQNIATPLIFWKYDKDYIDKKVSDLLDLVGLKDKANAYPSELSGGQKQRVAIARALALDPQILLSDEATSALDPKITNQILGLLKEINEKLGITIILVTHEMEAVKLIANRAMLLSGGNIVGMGDLVSLFLKPDNNMKEFLGEVEILPKENINIRIYFPPKVAFDCVITQMARELDENFNIIWGKIEKLGDNVVGSLVINVLESQFQRVDEFLKNSGVIYEIAKKEENNLQEGEK